MVTWYLFTLVAKGAGYLQFSIGFMSASHLYHAAIRVPAYVEPKPHLQEADGTSTSCTGQNRGNKQKRKISTFKKSNDGETLTQIPTGIGASQLNTP